MNENEKVSISYDVVASKMQNRVGTLSHELAIEQAKVQALLQERAELREENEQLRQQLEYAEEKKEVVPAEEEKLKKKSVKKAKNQGGKK